MILSAEQLFSDGQALTATGASTNLIDLGATGTVLGGPAALTRDIGPGNRIDILVSLAVDSGGTSPTLSVALQVDTTSAFSTPTTVATSETLAGGVAGDNLQLTWVPEGTDERYMRLNYTLGGTTPTYTVDAGIVMGRHTNTSGAGV